LFLGLGAALLALRGQPPSVTLLSDDLIAEVARAQARSVQRLAEADPDGPEEDVSSSECLPAAVSDSYAWLEERLGRYRVSRRAVAKSMKLTRRSLDWEPQVATDWQGPGTIANDAYKAERQEAHLRVMFDLSADVVRKSRGGAVPDCLADGFRTLGSEMRQITKDLEELMLAEHQERTKRGSTLVNELQASLKQNSEEAEQVFKALQVRFRQAESTP